MLASIADVRRYVSSRCHPLAPLAMAAGDALGLVLAEPFVAAEAVPGFTNSSMDGYALRAVDVVGAPARLAVVGALMAGDDPSGLELGPGQAVRVMTGAALPEGADAVCMVEHTRDEGPFVWVDEAVVAGTNVRPVGDDIAPGQVVFPAGTVLGAAHLGVLASLGAVQVAVRPRPRVGVVSTGDELVATAGPLPPGKVRDSNRPALLAQLATDGFSPVDLGHVGDDVEQLAASLQTAAQSCDALLTSGGVSVGDRDIVKMLLEKLGPDAGRWFQVAVKPAKPFVFSGLPPHGLPLFGLPGNPVSALVSYELFARPALRSMAGHPNLFRPRLRAVAAADLRRRRDGRTHLLRVALSVRADGALVVELAGGQGSHQMTALAGAGALAVLPDGEGVGAGEEVDVLLLSAEGLGGTDGLGAAGDPPVQVVPGRG